MKTTKRENGRDRVIWLSEKEALDTKKIEIPILQGIF